VGRAEAAAPSYLDVSVVGGLEGLVHRRGALPFAPVGVVLFGVDDPAAPAGLLEIHHHVHPPAQGPALLPRDGSRSVARFDPLLLLPVPAAPAGARALGPALTHDVLGGLGCPDEAVLSRRLVPGEDEQQDSVRHVLGQGWLAVAGVT